MAVGGLWGRGAWLAVCCSESRWKLAPAFSNKALKVRILAVNSGDKRGKVFTNFSSPALTSFICWAACLVKSGLDSSFFASNCAAWRAARSLAPFSADCRPGAADVCVPNACQAGTRPEAAGDWNRGGRREWRSMVSEGVPCIPAGGGMAGRRSRSAWPGSMRCDARCGPCGVSGVGLFAEGPPGAWWEGIRVETRCMAGLQRAISPWPGRGCIRRSRGGTPCSRDPAPSGARRAKRRRRVRSAGLNPAQPGTTRQAAQAATVSRSSAANSAWPRRRS
ncbi:hypothetical protein ACAN107058_22170 [Paracidovorax anthurii]